MPFFELKHFMNSNQAEKIVGQKVVLRLSNRWLSLLSNGEAETEEEEAGESTT